MKRGEYDIKRDKLDKSTPIWAQIINDLLIENKMTQSKLATKSKVSTGAISGIVTGAREPRIPNLKAIADVFNVSLDYLVGFSESRITDDHYKIGRNKFGLSDEAMKSLAEYKKEHWQLNKYQAPFSINEITGG